MKNNPDSAVPLWRESLRELHSTSYNLTSVRVEDYSGYRKGRRGPGYEAVLLPLLDVSRTGPQAKRGVSALYPTWRTHSVRPASAYDRSIGATNNDKVTLFATLSRDETDGRVTAHGLIKNGTLESAAWLEDFMCSSKHLDLQHRFSPKRVTRGMNALQYFQQVLEKAVDAHNAEAEQGSTELAPISEIKILADQENTSYSKLLRDLAGMDDPAEAASAPALWATRDKAYTAFARRTSQNRSLDLDRFRDPSSHIPAFSGHRGIKMYRLASENADDCEDDGDLKNSKLRFWRRSFPSRWMSTQQCEG